MTAVAGRRDPTYNSNVDPSLSVIKHVNTETLEQTVLAVNSLDRLVVSEVVSTNVLQASS